MTMCEMQNLKHASSIAQDHVYRFDVWPYRGKAFYRIKWYVQAGNANFASAREAMKSPLAKKLFATDGVKQVFFGSDFVTVTKAEDFRWAVLKPDILAAIADHIASGSSPEKKQAPPSIFLPRAVSAAYMSSSCFLAPWRQPHRCGLPGIYY